MEPRTTIECFDRYLEEKDISLRAVVIGATALSFLGVISRATKDCDVLDPDLPDNIKKAAEEFAARKRQEGWEIGDKWFNNGPASLRKDLSPGWINRLIPIFSGKALSLFTLGRDDLLKTKLFGYCDRFQDLEDCLALKPTKEELKDTLLWLQARDANPAWPEHVKKSLQRLAKRLGYEL
ncbi:MAG: hypothetical protein HY537_09415 [Deltaproteobacteria bacterium]|nr:hypothetical protein [Deltaproteobacteria bacterium]